jgi:hypothetical protein
MDKLYPSTNYFFLGDQTKRWENQRGKEGKEKAPILALNFQFELKNGV